MKGHIRKRSKNSWSIVIDVGKDPVTGKRKQQWHTVTGTKRDAERLLREMLVDMEKGTYVKPNRLTLGDWLNQWLNDYVAIHLTPSTIESYSYIVRQHLIPGLGSIPLAQLRPYHIQDYYARALRSGRIIGEGGLSPTSVLYHHRILREALDHGVRMEIVARNAADSVDPPRRNHPVMTVLSPGDIPAFLDSAQDSPYYVYFCSQFCTGCRPGEGLASRWRSFNDDLTCLYITETARKLNSGKYVIKEPKTPNSRRNVSLPASLTALLKQHKIDQEILWLRMGRKLTADDFVFAQADGNLPDPSSITRSFAEVLKNAGLPHIRIHDLRHTHATLLLKEGVHPKIVSERLGHASVAITLDIYSHVLPGLQEAAVERFDQILALGESNSGPDVSKMLANSEDLASRPCRSRTCDTLIKSQSIEFLP
jgi:integrase